MSQENCSNCLYFSAMHNVCRKKAPVPFLAGVSPSGQGMIITGYPTPPQGKDDWCGEHVPDGILPKH